MIQRQRKAAATAAKRNPNVRQVKDGKSGAFFIARAANETAAELARQSCPIEQAALALRRRGVVVYRMSVVDGAHDLFFVSSIGPDVTAEQLVEAARKIKK